MYPSIHDIQVSNYPSIQKKLVSKISKYPDIKKKWYPSIPTCMYFKKTVVTLSLGVLCNGVCTAKEKCAARMTPCAYSAARYSVGA